MTTVTRLTTGPTGAYDVHTDHGTWRARSVVVATGPHGRPLVPAAVGRSRRTRDHQQPVPEPPAASTAGGVLVVGASASGVQIADELARSGRDVVLAVGRHTRMPRRYRGMDVFWWLETTGRLARTIDEMPDPVAARREPSMQLVGRSRADEVASDVDLAALQREGVRLTGRLREPRRSHSAVRRRARGPHGGRRPSACTRCLDSVDSYVDRAGLTREVLRTGPPDGGHRRRARRPGSTCAPRGSGRSCWPPATARTTTGSTCRS